MAEINISMARGTEQAFTFTFYNVNTDGTKTPLNLSGHTVKFAAKKNKNDSDANFAIAPTTLVISGDDNNIGTLTITPALSKVQENIYYCEIMAKPTAGNAFQIATGTIEITYSLLANSWS